MNAARIRHGKEQLLEKVSSASAELLGCGSQKRPHPQSIYPTQVQYQASSQKQKPSGNTSAVALQDHVASVKSLIHQSEASTKPKGGIDEGLPPRVQGTIVSPSIQEEGCTSSGARGDYKTKRNIDPSNQSTYNIDANFLQKVVVAFEEVNANQEGSTRLAKGSIIVNTSLGRTFQAICEKHGNITKDCLLESEDMRTSVLQVICNVVHELQKKRLAEVDRNFLDSCYLIVKDAEKMKVNVNWLRTRLDEIRDAINCIIETKRVNDEMNRLVEQNENEKKDLESKKVELEKLKFEIDRRESQLELDTLVIEELSSMISNRALIIQQFQNMLLVDAFS